MPSGVLPELNATGYFQIAESVNRNQLRGVPTTLYKNSALSPSLLYSTAFASVCSVVTSHFSSSLFLNRRRSSMAASTSKAVLGEVYVDDIVSSCGGVLDCTKPSSVYFKDRTFKGSLIASVNLRRLERLNVPLNLRCSAFDANRRKNRNSSLPCGLKNSSFACFSAGAAHDVSFEGGTCDEQHASSTFSTDQAIVRGKNLELVSGACYLPHPAKEDTGGEDAHFICTGEQAIGVADGVGGWAEVGINAGLFARELMSNSVRAIEDEPKGSIDPARVLEKAHSSTKAKGSSTACIIALTDNGLHAINLGDSGFIVVRDGCTMFKSPVQQHDFNFTYQLESGNGADLPSSGEVFTIPVTPGDVIVAGTDGLFDNLFNNEITEVVLQAVKAGLEPQVTAQKIAALARQRAVDKTKQTPFSTAAQEAGFRYYGGKLDDITVVVSYITSSVSMSFMPS